ncbi:MAG: BlaI/MecI/CopY family transcriptional regulator [Geothrix sp.]|uniref:BlaI/MecI/CopY family transcriptional regulator n=1 Tax=Geothrix sp. TaxID=1962974 RepID=UPI001846FE10|nr:BlaI/MecI/CopY family transcriptional regulator [Geothrix sp.]NWJ40344.1 BlaI/MecI/CopY family transcriptional regulator [Geothrix sp.]WIL21650.1 MAG: BlaI/MecI/CopY family transcriptional regulator [Geothrix sp.]
MPELPRPSDFELAILRVLWRLGEGTVRQVHGALQAERQQGYTTVLKTMQIMAEKGLLRRDESAKSHVYRPAEAPQATRGSMVRDLVDKAFEGSALQLLAHALHAKRPSASELDEIQALIDQARLERRRK